MSSFRSARARLLKAHFDVVFKNGPNIIKQKLYDFDDLYCKSLYNSIFDARFFARMLGWWPPWKRARESVESMSFLRSRRVLLIIKQKYNFNVYPLRNCIFGAYFWRAYWDGDQLKERVNKACFLGGKRKKCQNAFFRVKLSFIFLPNFP